MFELVSEEGMCGLEEWRQSGGRTRHWDPVHWAGSERPSEQPCGFIPEANGSDWNQFKTSQDFGCDLQVVPGSPAVCSALQ